MERICEMGQVMRRAVQMDDQNYCSVRERLAQLEVNTVHHEIRNISIMPTVYENDIDLASLVGNMSRFTRSVNMLHE